MAVLFFIAAPDLSPVSSNRAGRVAIGGAIFISKGGGDAPGLLAGLSFSWIVGQSGNCSSAIQLLTP